MKSTFAYIDLEELYAFFFKSLPCLIIRNVYNFNFDALFYVRNKSRITSQYLDKSF